MSWWPWAGPLRSWPSEVSDAMGFSARAAEFRCLLRWFWCIGAVTYLGLLKAIFLKQKDGEPHKEGLFGYF